MRRYAGAKDDVSKKLLFTVSPRRLHSLQTSCTSLRGQLNDQTRNLSISKYEKITLTCILILYRIKCMFLFFTAFCDRIITFKEPMPNKVLKGYVIGREKVPNEGSCRVNCYLNPDCVSINMGPLTDGVLTCELNAATSGNEYSSRLEYQENHSYLEIEVISEISLRIIKMMT